jgi:hypothetical protein
MNNTVNLAACHWNRPCWIAIDPRRKVLGVGLLPDDKAALDQILKQGAGEGAK